MPVQTIEEIYDTQIRTRSREERRRLVEIVESDLSDTSTVVTTDPTSALFAAWEKEDAHLSPEEMEAEAKAFASLKQSLNDERDRAGSRRLF